MGNGKSAIVTGAGGFIGHHLVNRLVAEGYWVHGIDVKKPEFESTRAKAFSVIDLREHNPLLGLFKDVDEVYALAADMGGMGFISFNHAQILRNNLLMNLNTIEGARRAGIKRYFFASSACVYPEYRQDEANVDPLCEEDAYPAEPQDAYGWEKLTTEKLCEYYGKEYGEGEYHERPDGMKVRIARFHNIYGPLGTWRGGREKAPAALCRKIAEAKLSGNHEIEIWGDGKQTRSFCYIDDCIEGIRRIMGSEYQHPLNLGSEELISIDDLAVKIAKIAGIEITIKHIAGPQGVRGRNSDNTLIHEVLRWTPSITLDEGLGKTYSWVESQVKRTWAREQASTKATPSV